MDSNKGNTGYTPPLQPKKLEEKEEAEEVEDNNNDNCFRQKNPKKRLEDIIAEMAAVGPSPPTSPCQKNTYSDICSTTAIPPQKKTENTSTAFSMLLPPDIAMMATALEATHLIRLADTRGWELDDSIWHTIRKMLRVRGEVDRAHILAAFSSVIHFRFPSDILHMLMHIVPYPVPLLSRTPPFHQDDDDDDNDDHDDEAKMPPTTQTPKTRRMITTQPKHKIKTNAAACDTQVEAAKADTLLRGRVRATVHPGAPQCFNVVNLPDVLRVFELNTDWREHPEFNAAATFTKGAQAAATTFTFTKDAAIAMRPSLAITRLLDQLSLGSSASLLSATAAKPSFPCPFEIEKIPFGAIAAVCNTQQEDTAIEIFKVNPMFIYIYFFYSISVFFFLQFLVWSHTYILIKKHHTC